MPRTSEEVTPGLTVESIFFRFQVFSPFSRFLLGSLEAAAHTWPGSWQCTATWNLQNWGVAEQVEKQSGQPGSRESPNGVRLSTAGLDLQDWGLGPSLRACHSWPPGTQCPILRMVEMWRQSSVPSPQPAETVSHLRQLPQPLLASCCHLHSGWVFRKVR